MEGNGKKQLHKDNQIQLTLNEDQDNHHFPNIEHQYHNSSCAKDDESFNLDKFFSELSSHGNSLGDESEISTSNDYRQNLEISNNQDTINNDNNNSTYQSEDFISSNNYTYQPYINGHNLKEASSAIFETIFGCPQQSHNNNNNNIDQNDDKTITENFASPREPNFNLEDNLKKITETYSGNPEDFAPPNNSIPAELTTTGTYSDTNANIVTNINTNSNSNSNSNNNSNPLNKIYNYHDNVLDFLEPDAIQFLTEASLQTQQQTQNQNQNCAANFVSNTEGILNPKTKIPQKICWDEISPLTDKTTEVPSRQSSIGSIPKVNLVSPQQRYISKMKLEEDGKSNSEEGFKIPPAPLTTINIEKKIDNFNKQERNRFDFQTGPILIEASKCGTEYGDMLPFEKACFINLPLEYWGSKKVSEETRSWVLSELSWFDEKQTGSNKSSLCDEDIKLAEKDTYNQMLKETEENVIKVRKKQVKRNMNPIPAFFRPVSYLNVTGYTKKYIRKSPESVCGSLNFRVAGAWSRRSGEEERPNVKRRRK
ncbi:hypothetical protein PACTADRAFT_35062 [Pachysolen tannophilus NRRL Y-2460]|uniref:Uncharacterized protein n=1 Tax=Pachysolen tannophilus NRRL Y-2460 TaxID=669874 RepID=A0A1E4TR71_PACTA|nr:hypothetical protein PACTADRAFT_35062 [Pachysolen tannophilus NRRL Y-2460]